eukprot:Seg633.21 transcript_id=Seg633.21/GoldUCD/mRNA.D3Y31 product="hypothetical protein" protein_id=Seg633.21/GoldUCD/D3Y31
MMESRKALAVRRDELIKLMRDDCIITKNQNQYEVIINDPYNCLIVANLIDSETEEELRYEDIKSVVGQKNKILEACKKVADKRWTASNDSEESPSKILKGENSKSQAPQTTSLVANKDTRNSNEKLPKDPCIKICTVKSNVASAGDAVPNEQCQRDFNSYLVTLSDNEQSTIQKRYEQYVKESGETEDGNVVDTVSIEDDTPNGTSNERENVDSLELGEDMKSLREANRKLCEKVDNLASQQSQLNENFEILRGMVGDVLVAVVGELNKIEGGGFAAAINNTRKKVIRIEKLIKEAENAKAQADSSVLAFPIEEPTNEDAFDTITPLARYLVPSSPSDGPASIYNTQANTGNQQDFSRSSPEEAVPTSVMAPRNLTQGFTTISVIPPHVEMPYDANPLPSSLPGAYTERISFAPSQQFFESQTPERVKKVINTASHLQEIRQKSRSQGNFAKQLVFQIFHFNELENCNVRGTRSCGVQKERLDPSVMDWVKKTCLTMWPQRGTDDAKQWDECVKCINKAISDGKTKLKTKKNDS